MVPSLFELALCKASSPCSQVNGEQLPKRLAKQLESRQKNRKTFHEIVEKRITRIPEHCFSYSVQNRISLLRTLDNAEKLSRIPPHQMLKLYVVTGAFLRSKEPERLLSECTKSQMRVLLKYSGCVFRYFTQMLLCGRSDVPAQMVFWECSRRGWLDSATFRRFSSKEVLRSSSYEYEGRSQISYSNRTPLAD